MSSVDVSVLFKPLKLGDIEVANRLIMAPLTRNRAPDHLPNELMAEYYSQRASAGLLISECSMIRADAAAFGAEPGIYSEEQVARWQQTTDAVHRAGGRIFMQIWHPGRAAHPAFNNGQAPVAPSAIAIDDVVHTPDGKQPYTVPQALEQTEIKAIVENFRQAAANAIRAGFDGVEVHGANGYLIDQFLRESANQRTDEYGGSLANRARFLDEVLTAVCSEIGSGKVGLRLSPLNSFNSMKENDPVAWMSYLANHLNDYNLAYLHVMRGDFFNQQHADIIPVARDYYLGNLIVNMDYTPEEAAQSITNEEADAVALGKDFLATPDLPERIKQGATFNEPDPDTFYTEGPHGYTDYPTMDELTSA